MNHTNDICNIPPRRCSSLIMTSTSSDTDSQAFWHKQIFALIRRQKFMGYFNLPSSSPARFKRPNSLIRHFAMKHNTTEISPSKRLYDFDTRRVSSSTLYIWKDNSWGTYNLRQPPNQIDTLTSSFYSFAIVGICTVNVMKQQLSRCQVVMLQCSIEKRNFLRENDHHLPIALIWPG